ncbi:MAG: TRAM domain-containing protein [Planctomycetes bacterium]|nr:TRAM domain-containing protein [Planctomycetota bacterium]
MIWGIRFIFIVMSGIIGWRLTDILFHGDQAFGILGGVSTSLFFIAVEIGFTKKYVAIVSTVMFGLIFGFVLSSGFLNALMLLPWMKQLAQEGPAQNRDLLNWIEFCLTFLFSYIAVVVIIQCKDDYKFVVPFIEFARHGRSGRPMIVDTSAIIDGRVADVVDTRIIDCPLLVPRFVLQELLAVADSSDKLKRNRGRRGLDVLNRIRKNNLVDVQIHDVRMEGVEEVDVKLVRLAKTLDGRLLTTDLNLNKLAQLQGVEVINLNDIANALKPVVLPGESMEVKIIKPGEERGQGIGYLDDGTMVVVDGGYEKIGQKVHLSVTSVLQTSAGRMIFGTCRVGAT